MNKISFTIRPAGLNDIVQMVELSAQKRAAYEKVRPQFWQSAKTANLSQRDWFNTLLNNSDYFLYVAEQDKKLSGFIIGQLMKAQRYMIRVD